MEFWQLLYPFPHHTIQLKKGPRIAIVKAGSLVASPIIFIHGLGGYLPHWYFQIKDLSKEFLCIALDLPGYGKSEKDPARVSMSYYADIIHALCIHLQLKKVNLCGHSMGGQIALHFALRHPSMLEKLILIAPAGFEPFTIEEAKILKNLSSPAFFQSFNFEQIQANVLLNVYRPENLELEGLKLIRKLIEDRSHYKSAKDFSLYCQTVSAAVAAMLDAPVLDKLHSISNETLIIFGKQDALIPNRYLHKDMDLEKLVTEGARRLQRSRVIWIDECGHMPNIEKPQIVNQAIKAFLAPS
ncbi:MAG: alpha/beta fold hydrolase [Bacteroidia bacterium]|nr:alpha/beta fold hydrolase [Bacteroidia bacterium]MDW8157424.1 alpha/beta fold hydrolase [Bacteroidia bacterium]